MTTEKAGPTLKVQVKDYDPRYLHHWGTVRSPMDCKYWSGWSALLDVAKEELCLLSPQAPVGRLKEGDEMQLFRGPVQIATLVYEGV